MPSRAKGQAIEMTSPVRGRARRRWRRVALGALLLVAGLLMALPWLLETAPAQRQMAVAANRILAPGSVEFSAVRLSWFQPTEIANFVLHDAQGDRVIAAPRAMFSWSLWQTLVTRPKSATLTLDQSDVDIERFADGTVDLYETLKPVISEHPPVQIVIRIEDGRLRFRDPAFTDPVVADKANILLDLGANLNPLAGISSSRRPTRQMDQPVGWRLKELTVARTSGRRANTI